jgi:hypothetical protein
MAAALVAAGAAVHRTAAVVTVLGGLLRERQEAQWKPLPDHPRAHCSEVTAEMQRPSRVPRRWALHV